jgi:hypothetical protein
MPHRPRAPRADCLRAQNCGHQFISTLIGKRQSHLLTTNEREFNYEKFANVVFEQLHLRDYCTAQRHIEAIRNAMSAFASCGHAVELASVRVVP